MENKNLTLKDLQKKTNAPAYVIHYLKDCNRLPISKQSEGRGYPTLYKPEAVEVIQEHISKRNR
jgi:hypothetical protein